ncbi:MAG: PilZ domain-containing protein [Polyangiaceae bacterium]|nr:PilZ domain-containing protein [Polyangiaceae bacterium]
MRIPTVLAVLCAPSGGEPFGGLMVEVGLGGSRIESTRALDIGSSISLSVRLPGSPDLSQLPAIVRWRKPGLFGVQFGDLLARDARAIASMMAESLRT